MKTILLLRHAKSAWSDPRLDDHDRPLNRRGEQAAKAMADHIARHEPRPGSDPVLNGHADAPDAGAADQAVWTPPPRRLPWKRASTSPPRTSCWPHLQAVGDDIATVLLIGHNDGIWHLAEGLAGSGPADTLAALREKYPTGTLATLRARMDPGATWHRARPNWWPSCARATSPCALGAASALWGRCRPEYG